MKKIDLQTRCRNEVSELHAFFQQWFNAELADTDESFARFEKVLAPTFHIIGPDGKLASRQEILDIVRHAHGSSAQRGTAKIWIKDQRHLHTSGGMALVTYEEWQTRDGRTRGRLSTALLQEQFDMPNGVQWLHVHESWLDQD